MNKKILKIALGVMFGSAVGLSSCIKEIDESNLYTFTGQTIEDYLQANDSLFSDFNVIMERSGYDRQMSSYGQYTCYVPLNSISTAFTMIPQTIGRMLPAIRYCFITDLLKTPSRVSPTPFARR